jgi:hypothetical protein
MVLRADLGRYGLAVSFVQTLLAFVIGGAVTLVTQLILEARREKSARRLGDLTTEREVKAAARLVVLDLISMLALLRAARQTGRWWSELRLPTAAWKSHSGTLSRELDDQTWRMVGSTFAGALAWNELVTGARRYYWVMPRLNLRRLGVIEMHDEILTGAAVALRDLLAIAMPGVPEDDPLHRLATRALEEAG